MPYGEEEIDDQIKAVYANGLNEFLIRNASGDYPIKDLNVESDKEYN